MNTEPKDWRKASLELYRQAWSELSRWKGHTSTEAEFYVEELKEALLDLKEATLADDESRGRAHIDEVLLLLNELRSRLSEE